MIDENRWTWHDNAEIEIHPVGDEDVGDHTIAVMCEDGYYNREIALERAKLIANAPQTKQQRDELLEALKKSPAPDVFAQFAIFLFLS